MAKTLKREQCPECKSKNNLCTFETDAGLILLQCKTPKCKNNRAKKLDSYNESEGQEGWVSLFDRDKSLARNDETLVSLLDEEQVESYRGISPKILNKLQIKTGSDDSFIAQYTHTNLDGTVDIKYRWKDKKFSWAQPKSSTTSLFSLDKCVDFTKPVYITEGNEDCASVWELGHQACSLLSATNESGIENQLKTSLEYLLKFKSIIIATDIDHTTEVVRKTLNKLLSSKQRFEVDFTPYKDANEALLADKSFLECKLNNPVENLPDGLISGKQLDFKGLKSKTVKSIPLPWQGLNAALNGLEYGCLYLFLAGTSTGKSTVLRELAYWYRMNLTQLKIANFFFEENEDVTPLAYLALHMNIPLGTLRREINDLDQNVYDKAVKTILDTDNLMFINKDFSKNIDNLLSQIEYLVTVKGFELIIIDHISYIIGRTGTSKNGERIDIDNFIYKLQDLTQRLGCIIVAVSHVTESNGTKRWDEGEIPNIYSGRGSKALGQVPDGIIGLARNITNEYEKSVLSLYNLKNRWHSQTGKADELIYVNKTGRLITNDSFYK